jgi:hypothetical protein
LLAAANRAERRHPQVVLAGEFGSGRSTFAGRFTEAKAAKTKVRESDLLRCLPEDPLADSETSSLVTSSRAQDRGVPCQAPHVGWSRHVELVRHSAARQRWPPGSGLLQDCVRPARSRSG